VREELPQREAEKRSTAENIPYFKIIDGTPCSNKAIQSQASLTNITKSQP
jgi:hypothetical protein